MDTTVVRKALADQLTAGTGLRCQSEPKDQVNPPILLVLPPQIQYGQTMGPNGAAVANFRVLACVSDAAPTERSQRAADALLGTGPSSILAAVEADQTLSGTVSWVVVQSADTPRRFDYAGVIFFGGTIGLQVGEP